MRRITITIALCAVVGCGGGNVHAISALAAASDQVEERVCMPLDGPERAACIACARVVTDVAICELDSEACEELKSDVE